MTELERRKIQRQMFALEDEKEAVEARYRFLLEQGSGWYLQNVPQQRRGSGSKQ